MSGVFKAIGKAFKAVVKVIKKIAIPALIIGAIVLTGGAAIGALPAIGSILGSIGISGGLAATLGSAVTAAGIGGGIGLVTGGYKGMIKGGIMGAVTGGALGAVGAGGLLGGAAAKTASTGLYGVQSAGSAVGNLASKGLLAAASGGGAAAAAPVAGTLASGLFGNVAGTTSWAAPATSAAGGAATSAAGPALSTAAQAVKSTVLPAVSQTQPGLLSNLLQPSVLTGNSGLLGSLIGGIGQGMSETEALRAQAARDQQQRDFFTQNYGVTPGSSQVTGLLANYAPTGPTNFNTQPNNLSFQSPGRFEYDPTQRKVVFLPAQRAA